MRGLCTSTVRSTRTVFVLQLLFFNSISLVCFVGRGAGTDCSVLSTEAQTPVWKAATDQWAAARHAPPQMKISFHCRRGSPSHRSLCRSSMRRNAHTKYKLPSCTNTGRLAYSALRAFGHKLWTRTSCSWHSVPQSSICRPGPSRRTGQPLVHAAL
jgi:hypothetical protein